MSSGRKAKLLSVGIFAKADAIVRTRRWWLFFGMAVASVISMSTVFVTGPGAIRFWFAYVPSLVLMTICGQAWRRWLVVRRWQLEADDAGVRRDGRLEIARSAIRAAHVHRQGVVTIVRLVRTARPVDIVVADEREGKALIAALRLDAASAVATYRMSDGTHGRSFVRVGIIVLAFAALSVATIPLVLLSPLLGLTTFALIMVAYLVLLTRQHLTVAVGADGVRIKRWFGGAGFVRYADMERVTREGGNIFIHLRDGTVISMAKGVSRRVSKRLRLGDEQADEVDGFIERLDRHLLDHRSLEEAVHVGSLARSGRTTAQWLRDLRLANEAIATFRTPAIPNQVLWSVVEDAAAPPSHRVGAAVALRPTLDHPARARLRLAAQACAAPQLRVALESASAEDDGSALTSALDPIDDEPAPKRLQIGSVR